MSVDDAAVMDIGLVAHDATKRDLCDWAAAHAAALAPHRLHATGTTARMLREAVPQLQIHGLRSGPLGGDQQLGAMIAEGHLHLLVFFQDPMSPMPHDVDVKALVRLCAVYDIPLACNRMSGDMMITSPLFREPARLKARPQPEVRFSSYANRKVPDAE